MKGLKEVCFDVLGEFVDPKSLDIDEELGTVFMWVPKGVPTAQIRLDWNMAVSGTELEKARLILAPRP